MPETIPKRNCPFCPHIASSRKKLKKHVKKIHKKDLENWRVVTNSKAESLTPLEVMAKMQEKKKKKKWSF